MEDKENLLKTIDCPIKKTELRWRDRVWWFFTITTSKLVAKIMGLKSEITNNLWLTYKWLPRQQSTKVPIRAKQHGSHSNCTNTMPIVQKIRPSHTTLLTDDRSFWGVKWHFWVSEFWARINRYYKATIRWFQWVAENTPKCFSSYILQKSSFKALMPRIGSLVDILDEAIDSRAVFVIVSGSDGNAFGVS